MRNLVIVMCLFFAIRSHVHAQSLAPGFLKSELIELLKIGARTSLDTEYFAKMPSPAHSRLIYQSNLVGFDNLWQLWLRNDGVGIISIRGTTKTAISFYANLYAAMVPAKGNLQLEKDYNFDYNLSADPKAAVHAGYLVAAGYLLRDILPRIDSCVAQNINQFIVTGHSQGGAITYLLTSELAHLKQQGRLPATLKFKAVCVAAPKPGNLFYAYSFEQLTANGWSYNAVSSIDWVPEAPMSIQTFDDLNDTNPFRNAEQLIGRQKFPLNIGARIAYNQLSKPSRKAQRKYEKWLGDRFSKYIGKQLPGLERPVFVHSNNYVRTGTCIVMTPDSTYYDVFPQNPDSIWRNHTQRPYMYLAERLPDNGNEQTPEAQYQQLSGQWELDYIANQQQSFKTLYPGNAPTINFDLAKNSFSGNSGCNNIRGKVFVTETRISFSQPVTMTKMACPGDGESIFLRTLSEVKNYSVSAHSLTLIMDDMAVMHFVRR